MPSFLQFLSAESLYTGGTILSIALTSAFYLVARLLPPSAFAEVASLLSIAYLLNIGQGSTNNYVLSLWKKSEPLPIVLHKGCLFALIVSLLTILLTTLFAPALSEFLHFSNQTLILMLGLTSIVSNALGVVRGLLLGLQRTLSVNLLSIVENALRLVLGLLLFSHGYRSVDAITIVTVAMILTLLLGFFLLRNLSLRPAKKLNTSSNPFVGKETFFALSIILSQIAMVVSLKLNIFWGKHALSAADAGIFAAACLVTSILVHLLGNATSSTVSFLDHDNARTLERWSLWEMIGISILAVLVGGTIGRPLLVFILGSAYDVPSPLLAMLLVAMGGYAVATFCIGCLIVTSRLSHLVVSALLLALQGTLLVIIGQTPSGIALAAALAGVLSSMIGIFLLWKAKSFPSAHRRS